MSDEQNDICYPVISGSLLLHLSPTESIKAIKETQSQCIGHKTHLPLMQKLLSTTPQRNNNIEIRLSLP